MDLADIFRAAGRRWYVLIAGILITLGFAFIAYRLVPVTYDIKASVLLLPPAITVEELGGNPFLNLGGLDVAAGVLAKSLTDSASAEVILPRGSDAEYTVQKDASVSGSVLEIAVTDSTPEGALNTLLAIQDLAESRLQELQTEAAPTSANKLTMMVVTNNTVAEPNYGTLIRTLIVVGAAGLALTMLSAVAVDSLVRRHKAKKKAKAQAAAALVPTDRADTEVGAAADHAEADDAVSTSAGGGTDDDEVVDAEVVAAETGGSDAGSTDDRSTDDGSADADSADTAGTDTDPADADEAAAEQRTLAKKA